MKRLSALVIGLKPLRIVGSTDKDISSIEHNSRMCSNGTLFIAIKGTTNDGHSFITQAISNGANSIVCEKLPEDINSDITYIVVDDSRSAAADVSHIFYDFPSQKIKVYGVTGTNGKTTVTFILKQLLEAGGERCGIIGTTGNYIGDKKIETKYTTPEAPELCKLLAEMAEAGLTSVVMEVSSHSLVMQRVKGVRFCAALFTNLSHDHLDFHLTMDEYSRAKKILFDSLETDSVAIVNGDNGYSHFMLSSCVAKHKFLVGVEQRFDVTIHSIHTSLQETSFTLFIDGAFPESLHGNYTFHSSLLGFFNIENLALCISLAMFLGVPSDVITDTVKKICGAPGRMETINLPNGAVVIIDYAHTPDALEKVLRTCRNLLQSAGKGRLITVFGCGGNRDKSKRPLMGKAASDLSDSVIVTNDNPRFEDPNTIAEEILDGFVRIIPVEIVLDRKAAIISALSQTQKGDIVLIAGKGHETTQVIGETVLNINDRAIVKSFVM